MCIFQTKTGSLLKQNKQDPKKHSLNSKGKTLYNMHLIVFFCFRFFCSIGVSSEVCHVDPTGSLESRGFKSSPTKSPIKKSPIARPKQAKTGKKSQTGNPASGAAKRRKSNLADDEHDFEDCLGATSDKSQATPTLERKPRGRRRKD